MSLMDSHPLHPTLPPPHPVAQALLDAQSSQPPSLAASATASSGPVQSHHSPSSAPHPHQHHHLHHLHLHHSPAHLQRHQILDSSTPYNHPFRTITPIPADSHCKILDNQPSSKVSTPTNQSQSHSRPSSAGIAPPSNGNQQTTSATRRAYNNPSTPIEASAHRELTSGVATSGGSYPSPTATSASRRSSSNPNPSPSQTELVPPSSASSGPPAPPYFQQNSPQEPTSLAMIAAMGCSGMDVRAVYDDSRQAQPQNHSRSPSNSRGELEALKSQSFPSKLVAALQTGHSLIQCRILPPGFASTDPPSVDEARGSYYPPSSHYTPAGAAILPNTYPHLPPPAAHQCAPRRPNSSAGSYSAYHQLSVPVPLNSPSYSHHHRHHHLPHDSDAPPVPGWPSSIDSVRDSVGPYARPSRNPAAAVMGGHGISATAAAFGQPFRNGPILHGHHSPTPPGHPHQTGAMQYNAQGRPLSYICNTCLRAFDRPSALQIHERSHTGERPFACPWNACVKRFTTHGNMVKHSRVCPFREPED